MLAVIYHGGKDEKAYRLPLLEELNVLKNLPSINPPKEKLPNATRLTGGFIVAWGYTEWGQMFTHRQVIALQGLVDNVPKLGLNINESEYNKAIITYLGILIDRASAISTSFGRWDISREGVQSPFSKQAIPMIFDYPESNLFSSTTGSALNQLDWITRYIESESSNPFWVDLKNALSGDKAQFEDKYLLAVVTDPPYYDAIAYADLSDFFYVWLKRTLGDVYPLNFATPQTPKAEEFDTDIVK